MRGGSLRTVIRIERPITTANPYGDPQVRAWELVVETFGAKKVVSISSGNESERFDQRISTYDTEWRLRYRFPFDPRWRFVEKATGTIHNIVFAADPNGQRREILCRTRIDEPQPETEAVP
jgi:head-tail adaptor